MISDMYNCNKCKKEFENENDLINHNISKHSSKRLQSAEENISIKKSKIVCGACQRPFTDTTKLTSEKRLKVAI